VENDQENTELAGKKMKYEIEVLGILKKDDSRTYGRDRS